MSSFVVSARKYRPVKFDDVVGQQHVTQTLKNALRSDHLAHAFLFCGPRGVGKTTCARILAKVLNCTNVSGDFEPCNTCPSCESFNANASFNIIELDAASNNSVEHIRTLIEQVRFQPQQGKYKVFIIDEVHMLSQAAFNAFLKTLEEPPPYAIFILATTEKHKIIPTILSRCQIFDFRRIQTGDMVAHLESICREEGIEADPDALHIIAQKADGALRDALSIFDRIVAFSGGAIRYADVIENLNVLDYDYYFQVVDALLQSDSAQVMLIFDEILRKGFDGDLFLEGLAEHIRNLLVCKDEVTHVLLVVSDALKLRYQQQAALAPAGLLLTALSLVNDCDVQYKMARHKRLHVEIYLLKMAHIQHAFELATPIPPEDLPEKKSLARSEDPEPAASEKRPLPVTSPEEGVSPVPEAEAEKEIQADIVAEPIREKTPSINKVLPSISMKSLLDEARQETRETNSGVLAEINPQNLRNAWEAYAGTLDNPSVRIAFQQAQLEIIDPQHVEVSVGSNVAKNNIRQEGELLDFLKEKLQTSSLHLSYKLDKTLAPAAQAPKKPLTDMEKFKLLYEQNPLVKEIQERFDLRFDED